MHPLSKILCLLAMAACTPLAHAQVYHCIGVHGEPVYSGQPCGVPASSADHPALADAFGHVCADSPQALRDEIAKSFSHHDVNRLAGLMLWRGVDQASARATLRALSKWLKQPLAGIAIAYATGPPAPGVFPAPATSTVAGQRDGTTATPTGFEVSTADGSRRDFGVVESGGCWRLIP